MVLENKQVFLLVMCLSYGVILTDCEVVLVNRNVTDSFRVGKDGCTNDTSVCNVPNVAVTCQPDSGLCLCPAGAPNFRNPIVKIRSGNLQYGNSYGCVENVNVRQAPASVSEIPSCLFTPFKVIPYNHNDSVTTFYHHERSKTLQSCSFLKAWVKFPDNYTRMELQWLNETYVDLKIRSSYILDFKWKRSVPILQGTIISLSLRCILSPSSDIKRCVRAKVLGTWSTDTKQIKPTPATTKSTLSTGNPNSTATMGTSPTSSANSSQGHVANSNDDSNVTIIAIAVVVPVVLFIVLVVVIWLLCRRKNRHREGSINRKKNASRPSTSPAVIHFNEDQPAKSTPVIQRIEVNGDLYAIPEKNKNKPKDNGLNYLDPSALSITDSKETNGTESDQPTEYAAIVGVMRTKPDSAEK